MVYSRKFSAEDGGGMIPPDYSGVTYRAEHTKAFAEERRPRRALYKEGDSLLSVRRERTLPQEVPEDRYSDGQFSGHVTERERRELPSEKRGVRRPDGHAPSQGTHFHGQSRFGAGRPEKLPPEPFPEENSYSEPCPEDLESAPQHSEEAYEPEERENGRFKDEESTREKNGSREEPEKSRRGGIFSRLAGHSFTMEDILLAGIILLLLNGDEDSDLLLILGFLLLTGL